MEPEAERAGIKGREQGVGRRGNWLALGFSLLMTATASVARAVSRTSNGETDRAYVIQVQVYNYARVEPETLRRAEREVTRIFGRAGVNVDWIDCLRASDQAQAKRANRNGGGEFQRNNACFEPFIAEDLLLRVLPGSKHAKFRFGETTFGFATGSAVASVFYPRVEDSARWLGDPPETSVILGHVIAHEIGHLLLGRESHSLTGLMRARWDRRYLQGALAGHQYFTPEQSDRLRSAVLARAKQREAGVISRSALTH